MSRVGVFAALAAVTGTGVLVWLVPAAAAHDPVTGGRRGGGRAELQHEAVFGSVPTSQHLRHA